jgi:hypothetical protein
MTNFAQDMQIKTAWGLTLQQWNNASDRDRAYWRDMVTNAPHFQAGTQ